jgi:hypothetical protein
MKMGHGYYMMVGFGILGEQFGDNYPEPFVEKLWKIDIWFSCECKQKCMFIQIATDDDFSQKYHKLPPIDFNKITQMCNVGEACYLPKDYCDPTPYIEKWKKVQEIGTKYGIQIPDGKFMLVRDWD